ncbi:MAG: glycosyltransferase family 39 protein [Bacteroidota bacterium]
MEKFKLNWNLGTIIIWSFFLLKLLIHLFTYSNFELHRDAYLYYAQSEHLDWGFIAVPPFTAFIGKIATLLFGNTTFALRFFPALFGAFNILLIGYSVKELGGKHIAIFLACLAYLISPAFLHVNTLFQPVSFNHFFWLLSSYFFLLLINREEPRYWLFIAVAFGIGFLNKYSILFFYVAMGSGLLMTTSRKLFLSKYFIIACLLAIIIILPNLIWQYQHNWPVLFHMSELRSRQLVHVEPLSFLIDQLLMNVHALIIWMGALLMLLFKPENPNHRVFGLGYILLIVILLLGSGKSYYTLGIYPIYFAFGSYYFELLVKKRKILISGILASSMIFTWWGSIPFSGIPFGDFDLVRNTNGYRWEDGTLHDLPQDMADMTGWKEIGTKTAEIYASLGEDAKNFDIFCDHYGLAGSVMFYGKEKILPQPISFNASFIFWSPDNLEKDHLIWVYAPYKNDTNPEQRLNELFESYELSATINNPDFRENGVKIFICKNRNKKAKEFYSNRMGELKSRFIRNSN